MSSQKDQNESDQHEKDPEKRRFLRFEPDEVEIALLQFTEARPDEFFFEAEAAGLVIEEAYGGCALALLANSLPEGLETGAHCQIKVAKLGPMKAEIRWIQAVDDDISKIGLEYVDTR